MNPFTSNFEAAKTNQALKEENMQVQIVERSAEIDVAEQVRLFIHFALFVLLVFVYRGRIIRC